MSGGPQGSAPTHLKETHGETAQKASRLWPGTSLSLLGAQSPHWGAFQSLSLLGPLITGSAPGPLNYLTVTSSLSPEACIEPGWKLPMRPWEADLVTPLCPKYLRQGLPLQG